MPSSGAEVFTSRIVLDTSAYSKLRAGEPSVLDVVSQAEVVMVPTTVVGELEAGFRIGSRYAENRRALHDFLAEPFVTILDTTQDVAHRYGVVFAALRQAGTPIPINDVWIAATTLASGGHLVTFDEDFGRIEGLPHTLLET